MKTKLFIFSLLLGFFPVSYAQNISLTNTEIQLLSQDQQAKNSDIAIQEIDIASDNADMNARLNTVNQEQTSVVYEQNVIDQWNNAQINSVNGV